MKRCLVFHFGRASSHESFARTTRKSRTGLRSWKTSRKRPRNSNAKQQPSTKRLKGATRQRVLSDASCFIYGNIYRSAFVTGAVESTKKKERQAQEDCERTASTGKADERGGQSMREEGSEQKKRLHADIARMHFVLCHLPDLIGIIERSAQV